MADSESGQEKTEDPTPKRLEDARKKGQVPRSKELNTLALLLGAGFAMLILGPVILDGLQSLLVHSLNFGHERAHDPSSIATELRSAVKNILLLLAPMFLSMVAITVVSPIALGGWLFTCKSLAPKMERISPSKGLGRIFSVKSLLELIKSIAKFLLVATVVVFVLKLALKDIITLPMQDIEISTAQAGNLLIFCFIGFSIVLVVVVFIDVPYQLWDHKRQLMMTKQEVRDEMKETEGKPELKQAIRAKQQEIAQRRMMEEVPKADVIITNPTHYAIAIKYDQEGSGAPIVIAKGKDFVAAKIRELARDHKIAIFSAPPLARALYASTDLNQEIPENLFTAVAQVLAYIFQLRQAASSTRAIPIPPTDIRVPDEYTRKEQA